MNVHVPGVWSLVLALPRHWGGQGYAKAVLERMTNPEAQQMKMVIQCHVSNYMYDDTNWLMNVQTFFTVLGPLSEGFTNFLIGFGLVNELDIIGVAAQMIKMNFGNSTHCADA